MQHNDASARKLLLGVALASVLAMPAIAAKPPRTARPEPAAPAPPGPMDIQIPKSVYKAPENLREGRNPFFPGSNLGRATDGPVRTSAESYQLVLNGLTGPPRRTAMVNGRTFEEGETGEVRMPDGTRVTVKCLKIQDDSAIVQVGSQRKELRLRGGI